jgi:LysM repeat protein
MIAAMAARSPARFLAPVALLAFVLALFIVISQSSQTSGGGGGSSATSGEQAPKTPASDDGGAQRSPEKAGRRFYRVKAGDTPSAIAEQAGIPLSQLLELNPDLDPQSLTPGQRLRLRR